MALVAEPLADHDVSGFRGNDELDAWLVQSARAAVGQGRRTWVVVDGDGVGGRLVVDAIDADAHRLYVHHDFLPIPNDDRRLVIKRSTVAKAFRVEWPQPAWSTACRFRACGRPRVEGEVPESGNTASSNLATPHSKSRPWYLPHRG